MVGRGHLAIHDDPDAVRIRLEACILHHTAKHTSKVEIFIALGGKMLGPRQAEQLPDERIETRRFAIDARKGSFCAFRRLPRQPDGKLQSCQW